MMIAAHAPFARAAGIMLALVLMLIPAAAHEGHGSDNGSGTAYPVESAALGADQAGENKETSADDGAESAFLASGSVGYRTIRYAGKFHILVVHFPISFLLAAMVAQWFEVARERGRTVVRVLLWCGALSAVIAAGLGWMHAYYSVYFGGDAEILKWHEWLGTATAVAAVLVLALRRWLGPKTLAVALTICAVLVGAAGHFGGSLVHGPDFLFKF